VLGSAVGASVGHVLAAKAKVGRVWGLLAAGECWMQARATPGRRDGRGIGRVLDGGRGGRWVSPARQDGWAFHEF
jgi:hypothetical protein